MERPMNTYEIDFDYSNGSSVGSAVKRVKAKSIKDALDKLENELGYGKVSNATCRRIA